MKKIGVLNHKGGVGKTIITAHLLWYLAERGYRVMGIDCDTQKHLMKLISGYEFKGGDSVVMSDDSGGSIVVFFGHDKVLSDVWKNRSEDFCIIDGRPTIEVMATVMENLDLVIVPTDGRLSYESVADIKKIRDNLSPHTPLLIIRNKIDDIRPALREREKWLLAGLNGELFGVGLVQSGLIRTSEYYGMPLWKIKGYGVHRSKVPYFFEDLCDRLEEI